MAHVIKTSDSPTGGTGTVATRSARTARATSELSEAERASARATDIQSRMPTVSYRVDKTIATQAGDRGAISISGETFDDHASQLTRIGEDPALLKTQSSAQMNATAAEFGHTMPRHGLDATNHRPSGWYNGTHAEMRVLSDAPKTPVGVTRPPCTAGCDPGITELSHHGGHDIVVRALEGVHLHRPDRSVVLNPSPSDFTGVNSRWPGALWGGVGATSGVFSGAAP